MFPAGRTIVLCKCRHFSPTNAEAIHQIVKEVHGKRRSISKYRRQGSAAPSATPEANKGSSRRRSRRERETSRPTQNPSVVGSVRRRVCCHLTSLSERPRLPQKARTRRTLSATPKHIPTTNSLVSACRPLARLRRRHTQPSFRSDMCAGSESTPGALARRSCAAPGPL